LRFFTRRSGAALLRQSGLELRSTASNLAGGRRYALLNLLTFGVMRDFLCAQHIYVGTKP
jgi:hypothetical protein